MSWAMVWIVCVPIFGALAAFGAPRRLGPLVGMTSAVTMVPVVGWMAWFITAHGPQRYAIGGWDAPLGIQWYADGLSVLMMGVTALVNLLISLYAISYFPPEQSDRRWSERHGFWPLWLMLAAAFNVIFLSADLFNLYVGLELLGLAAVALVTVGGGYNALTGAMRYLLAAMLGSLTYLLGVALLYGQHGTLDIDLLGQQVTAGPVAWVALALMSVGLMLKTALFPLHFWLPPAHAHAPAPVSAVLSALVVKASFYVLLRLWFGVFGDAVDSVAAQFVGVLAAAAIIGGSVQAILQRRLKMLIAYSTAAQIGYLFLLVPLMIPPVPTGSEAVQWNVNAWSGGIYQLISHAFAKAAMFLAAGTVMVSLGSDRIRQLRGMASELPVTTFTFGLAGITLIGLPPSGGFLAKWYLVNAAIETGQWWWAVVVLFGGLLAAMYVFLVLRYAFLPPAPPHFRTPPRSMVIAALMLAVISMLLGLRGDEVLELLWIGTPLEEANHE